MATISIKQGILKGSKCYTDKGNEYFEFLCIPYAKPPVGNLRFKSPELPEPWEGVRDATIASQNKVACQMDLIKLYYKGTEDCLYLNVYTPKLPNDADKSGLLPVMFYIHGGGFAHGCGVIKAESGPDYLIDNNVVVVSINYRLGIVGFLSLDLPEAAGNMGLKDQVQALIWVQNNIDKFGGDKNNVTIFGVSAGAASVEYLILSPKAKGLFHKAILQSGSSLNHWAIDFEPQNLVQKLLQRLEFEGSTQNHREVYEYLMTCPSKLLIEESHKVAMESAPDRLFFGFVPTIEIDFGNGEAFLTKNPYKLLKEGRFYKVPVIKGYCEMEGYLMSLVKPSSFQELNANRNFIRHFAYTIDTVDEGIFNDKFARAYNNFTNVVTEEDNRDIVHFFGDYDFISGIWLSGDIMADYGVDVYFYKFSYDGKMNFLKNLFNIEKKGACHADEVSYIFKTEISHLADESDVSVQEKVTNLWTNFAKTSNPTKPMPVSGDYSTWPLFTRSSSKCLNIDKTFTIESFPDTNKMDIFKEMYEKYEQ